MSNAMQVALAYAADFEKTYEDDDWGRLAKYFAESATYDVVGGPMACHIAGRDNIFAGIRKSLQGFDRHFDSREIELLGEPAVVAVPAGEEIHLRWQVSYQRGETPLMRLPGASCVTVADDVIIALRDDYDDAELGEVAAWMASHGAGLDPSYV